MEFDSYRALFPVTKKYIFLNHAAAAPASLRLVEAVKKFYEECAEQGTKGYFQWMEKIAGIRVMAAGLINAKDHEIAFMGNTSQGLGAIAGGLDWRPGDVVLVPVPDFPSNIYPWMHLEKKGVKVRFVERQNGHLSIKEVARALVPGAKMLTVSSVDYATGYAANLKELGSFCKEKGLLFCVDAIQSLGVIPLDVKECGIHFMACGSHKWLLGPFGAGILYVDNHVNDLIKPECVGWKSVINEEDFNIHFVLKSDALRFEPGTMNLSGIFGLGASLELLNEVGITNIYKKVMYLNDLITKQLSQRSLKKKIVINSSLRDKERSGIITFKLSGDTAGDTNRCFKFLSDRQIMVSLRQNRIRLSPHFYNNKEDVAAFFTVLDEFTNLT